MIEIRTAFTPFKMRISRREPVTLSIELSNNGEEAEIISFHLSLGNQFSVEKSGYRSEVMEKIPDFKPGQSKKYYFDLWPKQMLRPGEQTIRLRATEHYKDYNYVKRSYDKVLKLTVEE